ncbi:MAG: ABC transporter permease [Acholeplasmatales bacterium]|jgi:ribose transport system permease protein|nr:ABC transporter permease [Acholeplasmatales bacterium]
MQEPQVLEKPKILKDIFKKLGISLKDFFHSLLQAIILLFTHPKVFVKKYKNKIIGVTPLLSLIILFLLYMLLYTVMNGGRRQFGSYEISMIINQGATVAVIATGAIFIYSIGAFDLALGASSAIGALAGLIVYNQTGNLFLFFLVSLASCSAVGIFNALLTALFKLPIYIVTVAMLSILTALIQVFLNGTPNLRMNDEYFQTFRNIMNVVWVRILIIGLFFILSLFIFNYTKIGKRNKFMGGNLIAAKQTGINLGFQILFTFIISGIGVGLGAMLTLSRSSTVEMGTNANIGMDVLMAIVFGGMPMAGGAKSKVSAGLIGAFSITIFSLILSLFQLSPGWVQLLKALLFLAVVMLSYLSNRTKILSR